MPSGAYYDSLQILEHKIAQQPDPAKRLYLLDSFIVSYIFTHVLKARTLLAEQRELLEQVSNPDIALNYHYNAALVENQLYAYQASAHHFEAALELIEERGTIGQQAEALIDYAGTLLNLSRYEEVLDVIDKANRLLEVFPDERLLARIICRQGVLNLHVSNYTKAIELLLEAEKKISLLPDLQLKDHYFLTLIHSGLGTIYQQNGERDKCVKAHQKVLDICEKTGMRSRLSWHYLNIGRSYIAIDEIEHAEAKFHKALNSTDDSSESARAGAYANLGYCHFLKGEYKEALNLYNKAEHLYKRKNAADHSNLFVIESWRGNLYLRTGKETEALLHMTRAFKHAKAKNDFKQLSIICKEIADFYNRRKDYKNAYEYLDLHNNMAERYREELNKRTMMEMEVKYQAEKRSREAELLRLQAINLQLKALRAQMNPHFMYNALNSIQHYITSNQSVAAAKYLAKFAKLMRQSLDYSDLEFISLEKEIEFLRDYLEINQKLRFEDSLNYKIIVDDEIEEDIMGVPTMIVQPYVENAIEHGLRTIKKGLVKLEFYLHDENTILCIVQDNGIGRKKAEAYKRNSALQSDHRSKGTSITERRLELLHKARSRDAVFVTTYDLTDSATGKALGTRVEIQIPIVDVQIKK